MLQFVLLTILGACYLTWLYRRYHSTWKYFARFPGPVALPLFGNVLQFDTSPEGLCRKISCWLSQYKFQPFRLYGGPHPYVLISSPEHLKTILTSTTILEKGDLYNFMKPFLGEGLVTSHGLHWAKHRKIITPSFHFQILQDFHDIINDTTDRLMIFLNDFAKTGQIFDFEAAVARSTLDVICECAMGYRLNSIEGGESPMTKAIHDMSKVVMERMLGAAKRSDLFFYLTPSYRTQQNAIKTMRDEYMKIIASRRKIIEEQNTETIPTDDLDYKRPKMAFLDNLLTARIDGVPLTFQEICDETTTFLSAGFETTAAALAFTAYCLSRHSEVQQKAFQEQFDIFGSDVKRQPTYQELNDMKYLEMVIKETFRIFPPSPGIARKTTTLTKLGDYEIPPDTTILIMIRGTGVNPKYFEEPYKFQPERFAADRLEHINPFAYVPFSAGPRNCIGQKFAMMEIKSTLSKVLRNFVILPAVDGLGSGIHEPHVIPKNPYDVKLFVAVTLKSSNGIQLRLQPRIYESTKL